MLQVKIAPIQPSMTAAFHLQSRIDSDCQMWEFTKLIYVQWDPGSHDLLEIKVWLMTQILWYDTHFVFQQTMFSFKNLNSCKANLWSRLNTLQAGAPFTNMV